MDIFKVSTVWRTQRYIQSKIIELKKEQLFSVPVKIEPRHFTGPMT